MKAKKFSITLSVLLTAFWVGGTALASDTSILDSRSSDSALEAPKLTVKIDGNVVTLSWNKVTGATDYDVHYARKPYDNPDTIKTIEVGNKLSASYEFSPGSVYHVAVKACDVSGVNCSDYSIIHDIVIPLVSTYKNSFGQDFKLIPAGTYSRSSDSDEFGRLPGETQHQVTLTKSFYMQITEVTQREWQEIMGYNPSYFSGCSACPVEMASWNDIKQNRERREQRKGDASRPGGREPLSEAQKAEIISIADHDWTADFPMSKTISDAAQVTTLAFSALAMMTGTLPNQTFFPPGKVADYTGFQYFRDVDEDGMGHTGNFLTRIACNVISILTMEQLALLDSAATVQNNNYVLYGYKRYTLMQAFRLILEGDLPAGTTGLDLEAVKEFSKELYIIDGQISFDRAFVYAQVLASMDSTQIAYLDTMAQGGFNSWPDISKDDVSDKFDSLSPEGRSTIMGYAGDLFTWHAGSVIADVYFCPERQGTYYGGFWMKDAPAMGQPGYAIPTEMTGEAGKALSDASLGYVTEDQAAVMNTLVNIQRNNLYDGTPNILQIRANIATLLRLLLVSMDNADAIEAEVLSQSATYGELDGENNYNYAQVFAEVYQSLSNEQKTKLYNLRASLMSGTYDDGTPFDFTYDDTYYHYGTAIEDESIIIPYVDDADALFINAPSCPDCSNDSVNLKIFSFVSGSVCECSAATSITIGSGVTVEDGATVTFKAPKVSVKSGARFHNGSKVTIKQ